MTKIFTTLFLGLSAIVYSQNILKGKVTNVNKELIKGVSISIPELHKEVVTDESGSFKIDKLASGSFSIIFFHPNYDTYTSIVMLDKKENICDVVLLEEHTHHIEEVIVSTAFNKAQSQNVMKVEHSSLKALQQKGGATLMESIATIPGISNVSTGVSIGKPVIRGLSGNRVLVYSQGVRLENQQFGEEHGLGLSDSGVESIEVIKGPASLLYGSDALGGVLYFNPEKFAQSGTYVADFSQKYFTNTQGISTGFGLKSSAEHWKFSVRGAHNAHSDYLTGSDQRVTNSRFNETDAKMALGYYNTRFSSVLRYNVNNLDLGLPEELGEQSLSKKTNYPKQRVIGQIASWNNILFFKKSKLEAEVGYVSNNRKEFENSPIASLSMNLQTVNYNLKYYTPKIGHLETIIGIQGMYQTNKNSAEEILIPNAKTHDLGFLTTSMYSWSKNTIQAGLRFDIRSLETSLHGKEGEEEEAYFKPIDKKFNSINASLGYKTNLLDNLLMRINLASGFRAPNLAELTSNGIHEGSNRYEKGNENLRNEQNIQMDFNLEYGNSHLELFANGFYNHIKNYIYIAPTGNRIEDKDVYTYEQANAALYGGEMGVHLHPHPIDWLHITSSFEMVIGKKKDNEFLPLIPANKWVNAIKAQFNLNKTIKEGYIFANYETNFAQHNISTFEMTTPSYSLLNFGLGGNLSLFKLNFTANLVANNILNEKYIAHLSRLKNNNIQNMGRNIMLGINFKI
ncbi:putative TonB-dependent receptor precursor [Flavobacterium columnare]|uniref:TonB-dependent receptor n=2 Tax=Flavobacterium TaxID=237 RepID=A0ABW8PQT9_9FLAO|nr:TonB-dependent receptor [Flavobacterium columnare]SPE77646.1 putative TonB-dependent receptor precursor [Flavobacterium columnare]